MPLKKEKVFPFFFFLHSILNLDEQNFPPKLAHVLRIIFLQHNNPFLCTYSSGISRLLGRPIQYVNDNIQHFALSLALSVTEPDIKVQLSLNISTTRTHTMTSKALSFDWSTRRLAPFPSPGPERRNTLSVERHNIQTRNSIKSTGMKRTKYTSRLLGRKTMTVIKMESGQTKPTVMFLTRIHLSPFRLR